MFPPTYIPNDSERISLYRELDNMEEERDILAFTERLKDRFGKIPKEGKELIRSFAFVAWQRHWVWKRSS